VNEARRNIPECRYHIHEFVYPDYHEWPFPDTFDPGAQRDNKLIPDVVKTWPHDLEVPWDYSYYSCCPDPDPK